ncbi:glycoprotein 3-alpha-L-fucosyltransferase A-like isoform X2 [Ostrea edulis]|nr:glycoprotein 3-alpha-L-fucosyltransferase A-like isoform X2 [Ostrea edulis]XP_056008941.1 glycoprotein 3-alpha-L-fucosyltransferase A-like isoform X2 [Ostrea edulis]XP_056008942.1 glycoprotein 3-alpha-L-fucosyltransferase A-like isoform X2 [Ostrea edulis]
MVERSCPTFKVAVLISVTSILVTANYLYNMNYDVFLKSKSSNTSYSDKEINQFISDKKVSILVYGAPAYLNPFIDHFHKTKCPTVPECFVSKRQADFQNSTAVIFNAGSLPGRPPKKMEKQYWIFHGMETVHYMPKPGQKWNDQFDYTMSFRKHSDIFRPYGKIKRREKELSRNYSAVFQKKKLGAVWMSGHCPVPSKRKAFAQELGKYMHVDLFGKCGTRPCGTRSTLLSQCLMNVARDYNFYLSFENTICPDYTTEKLFNLYLYDLEIIPVVNGPDNAADYLPNGTYINALHFASAKELAQELLEIGSNEKKYIKYLKEKDRYFDVGNGEVFSDAMCQICEKVAKNPKRKSKTWNYWTSMLKDGC